MHPRNWKEYEARCQRNVQVSGVGVQTRLTVPCPFCGAKGWKSYNLLEIGQAIVENSTCRHCTRSARALMTVVGDLHCFEMVQTGGPEQEVWFVPQMRRVEEGGDSRENMGEDQGVVRGQVPSAAT